MHFLGFVLLSAFLGRARACEMTSHSIKKILANHRISRARVFHTWRLGILRVRTRECLALIPRNTWTIVLGICWRIEYVSGPDSAVYPSWYTSNLGFRRQVEARTVLAVSNCRAVSSFEARNCLA
jgi:hypothetical protein